MTRCLFSRRRLLPLMGWSLAALGLPALAQEAYPSKPIRIIIPTPAGGALDGTARLIGEKLTEAWKQPVIVESRAGGNGAIAYGAVAKSAPDGHTLSLTISSLVQTTLLSRTPSYSLKELTPVSLVAIFPNGFAVSKDVPASTLPQFVEWARKQPAGVDYGSSGAGSSGNILGATFAQAAKIDLVHVPFKGEAPSVQALIGGQIKAVVGATGTMAVQAKAGNMKLLAVAAPTRLRDYPDLPTFAEAGYPAANLAGWSMAVVPAGTPKAIVDKLSSEIARIMRLPDVSARIYAYGFEPEGTSAEFASRFINDEVKHWTSAIKAANVTIE